MRRTVALVYGDKTSELTEVLAAISCRCVAQEFHHSEFFDFDSFDFVVFFQLNSSYNKVLRDKIHLTQGETNKVIQADITSAPAVVAYKLMERLQEKPSHPSVFGALQPVMDRLIGLVPGKEVAVQFEHNKSTLEEFAFRLQSVEPKPAALFELKLFDMALSRLIFSQRVSAREIRKDGYAKVALPNPYRKSGPISMIASIQCINSDSNHPAIHVGATSEFTEYYLIEDRVKKPGAPTFYTR